MWSFKSKRTPALLLPPTNRVIMGVQVYHKVNFSSVIRSLINYLSKSLCFHRVLNSIYPHRRVPSSWHNPQNICVTFPDTSPKAPKRSHAGLWPAFLPESLPNRESTWFLFLCMLEALWPGSFCPTQQAEISDAEVCAKRSLPAEMRPSFLQTLSLLSSAAVVRQNGLATMPPTLEKRNKILPILVRVEKADSSLGNFWGSIWKITQMFELYQNEWDFQEEVKLNSTWVKTIDFLSRAFVVSDYDEKLTQDFAPWSGGRKQKLSHDWKTTLQTNEPYYNSNKPTRFYRLHPIWVSDLCHNATWYLWTLTSAYDL